MRKETEKVITYNFLKSEDTKPTFGGYKMIIECSDCNTPVSKLRHLSMNRDEIEDFTYNFAMKLFSNEPNLGRVWIINSNPYFKKKNLTMDRAEWSGWEIQASKLAYYYLR